MNKRDRDRLERQLDNVGDMHDCNPDRWTARVSSPGWDATHAGMSRWTCDTCRPMVAELMNQLYGGHDEAFKP